MRTAALLVIATVLASAGPAFAEQTGTVETFGRWRIAWSPRDRATIAWAQADGTVAAPDICRGFVERIWPEKFSQADAAAIRRQRAACIVLSCMPARGSWPPRYEAIIVLFGATGAAYEALPRGQARLRPEIMLRLDGRRLALDIGLIAPIPVEKFANGSWSLVPFRAAPIQRATLEQILGGRRAVAPPVNQFFAAYIWVVPFTSGAYTFDLSGGAAALARLDERCR